MSESASRWGADRSVRRGADYDARWKQLAAAGQSVHGEADFVCRFEPASVLDAGCGTGRVAIELAARGIDAVGVDLDEPMLAQARTKAPDVDWHLASIADVQLDRRFDVVVMAGNVMVFVEPGTEHACVANLAGHIEPGGVLAAGFRLDTSYGTDEYDADCTAAGLQLDARYATWDGDPYDGGGYAVSVHRR